MISLLQVASILLLSAVCGLLAYRLGISLYL